MILEKKSTFPGKKSKTLETNINLLETQFKVPLILWSPGPLVPCSSAPLVLWSLGPLVPGSLLSSSWSFTLLIL